MKCADAFLDNAACTQDAQECGAGLKCDTDDLCAKDTATSCAATSECAGDLVCDATNFKDGNGDKI